MCVYSVLVFTKCGHHHTEIHRVYPGTNDRCPGDCTQTPSNTEWNRIRMWCEECQKNRDNDPARKRRREERWDRENKARKERYKQQGGGGSSSSGTHRSSTSTGTRTHKSSTGTRKSTRTRGLEDENDDDDGGDNESIASGSSGSLEKHEESVNRERMRAFSFWGKERDDVTYTKGNVRDLEEQVKKANTRDLEGHVNKAKKRWTLWKFSGIQLCGGLPVCCCC
jgi:hypothetical protein